MVCWHIRPRDQQAFLRRLKGLVEHIEEEVSEDTSGGSRGVPESRNAAPWCSLGTEMAGFRTSIHFVADQRMTSS